MKHAGRAVIVDRLRVERGRREVLHGVSFDVPQGQVTGVLGPNGSGKTTLLRSIAGVQIVAGGTVTVLGEPAGSPALRDRIGYATQSAAIYQDLTIRENLRFFASILGAPSADVSRVVNEVALAGLEDRLAGRLSGGQLSRASLAVALLGNPELLVLDEPTVGLDPVTRHELWEFFHRLAGRGVTLLISSHVMDEASHCDRLLLLRDGEILGHETPAALLANTGAADLESAFLQLVGQHDAVERTQEDAVERPQEGVGGT